MMLGVRTAMSAMGRRIPTGSGYVRSAMSPVASISRPYSAPASKEPHPSEGFLSGTSSNYFDEMHRAWKQNPSSVHKSWDVYFKNLAAGAPPGEAFVAPPSLGGAPGRPTGATVSADVIADHLKVQSLIRAYQVRGHNIANLDPLGINEVDLDSEVAPELQPQNYGFTEKDLDREFTIGTALTAGFMSADRPSMTLREIINRLQETYSKTIGIEYMHIPSREQCNWIRERIETRSKVQPDIEERRLILARLIRAEGFENFLAQKWSSEKRFGLEGGESLIPGMKAIIDRASEVGIEAIVMGMPHRGRLNVMGNVMRKPLETMFSEFTPSIDPNFIGSGDVKYHLGTSHDHVSKKTGKTVHLSLVANPSHLEAVNPVVQGKTRAEQYYRGDHTHDKVMSILLHGDAAFSGQGVVFETIGLSDLPYYTIGGTIHIVVNNQIGFTTDPRFSRSSPYCTDVAKTVGAPIFHVNGDDPEAVVQVCRLAMDWRTKFKKDVVIDIVCYRRHGHNEVDQPAFTQPLMYQRIAKHPTPLRIYADRLKAEGIVTEEEIAKEISKYKDVCVQAYEASKSYKSKPGDWLESYWHGFKSLTQLSRIRDTGVDVNILKRVGNTISSYPSDFAVHPALAKILGARMKMIETGQDIDWATGEALAFGTLLLEKNHVRLSGQDVERGTFSQRHHVLHDQKLDGKMYVPLNHLGAGQETYTVTNSSLSEYGVMGFELGYSMTRPNALVMWEAQFGDFANTAQVIIDQFISAGETKWLRQSGIVLLLPHAYEGMGPEHSSARLERFLQMSDDDPDVFPDMDHETRRQIQECNWQVVNCSTPANYYHVLRRQIHREFRKPLIVVTPKSLLRHPRARSTLADMKPGTRFRRLINEEILQPKSKDDIKRIVFCSGKIYYDLLKYREDHNISNVAIARVEQISPFPFDLIVRQAADFPKAEIVWCQEEPKNMGSWSYVGPRIETALKKSTTHSGLRPRYVGREPSASTATGNKKVHMAEEAVLLKEALVV